jgi:hypothetical protein
MRRSTINGWFVTAFAITTTGITAFAAKGTTTAEPYLEPTASNIHVYAILTVGDSVNTKPDGTPYPLVGNPDGLGAYDNGDGTFTLLVNHEISSTLGAVHAHGARGAFISKWTVRKGSLKVEHGEDLIHTVMLWNGTAHVATPNVPFNRFCSANLPPRAAFFNDATGLGFDGRMFLNGEEPGALGRAFAHGLDGTSYQLPHLGRAAFENVLANPSTGDKSVVMANDDSTDGQVYLYIGAKKNTGTSVDKAGLTGGQLYGVRVDGIGKENDATTIAPGARFSLFTLGDVSALSGAALQTASRGPGSDPATFNVTEFNRPEDGSWDPNQPNHYYFNTTASFAGRSRLWRLRFDDVNHPEAGGVAEMLLVGTEGHKQLDNLAVSRFGTVMLQEDPGNVDHLAKLWRYDIASGQLDEIAHHAPKFFDPAGSAFITTDEESSGIIDVSDILGQGHFLLTSQAHKRLDDPELVEMGQLLAVHVPPGQP